MPPRATTFGHLAEAIGPDAALVLVAFFRGQRTLYVPGYRRHGHLLERLLGEGGFLRMVAHFGGETLCLPQVSMEPERRAGAVYRGMRAGMTTQKIADQLGVTFRRVRQIEAAIRSGAPLTAIAKKDR